jgi:ATP-binding cassette, subfamily B, bacterial
VSFSYDSGKRALRQVTLSVAPGRNVAIVGPSGAGKSTLISLLLRLYDPLEGRVLVDGVDVRSYTLKSLRAQFSMVLQDTVLFATSVRENITAGLPDVTEEDVRSAAELANATDFIESLPEGFDTVLGERGVTLSKGQRQRIAIARAALKKASILILDEPTTGLDEENSGALIGALERLARDRTTIIISHDLRFGLRADQILYLEGGRLLEEGSHDELTARQGRYSQLYQQQLASLNSKVRNPASNPPKKAKMGASGT